MLYAYEVVQWYRHRLHVNTSVNGQSRSGTRSRGIHVVNEIAGIYLTRVHRGYPRQARTVMTTGSEACDEVVLRETPVISFIPKQALRQIVRMPETKISRYRY